MKYILCAIRSSFGQLPAALTYRFHSSFFLYHLFFFRVAYHQLESFLGRDLGSFNGSKHHIPVIYNMGNLIWSDWGRLVALTAGYWNLWGALWGIFYRKYFWDFVGGKLGPVGIIPPGSAAPFIQFIVTVPAVQGACLICGLFTVLFEWPLLPETFLYRSLAFKTVFYCISALLAALVYQTADATVIYVVAILAYTVALTKGEIVGEKAVDNSRV
ncbi:hypothetical protein Pst134EA_001019 [Puccinia striiformis f. sp. tritici]|uniref:hypothetical protein n=1 Tax=Puccinia striiformis f. sp. tritici TaxID=168172 RepID=UPI002008DDF3|nr:hypothetical protein Pst134EA_001019 [Puccinia striiformis f. sp. tritici]KAH9473964.1 hypothetical protein Pst134EA_001019 [Puccinia striiformis f. sp. tritici]